MNPMNATKLLADEYNVKIITACYGKPASAQWLAMEYDIPIAACYRKIAILEKYGILVKEQQVLTRQGKRVWMYRSIVKSAHLALENGKLRVKFELGDSSEKLDEMWNAVDVMTIQK